MPDLENIAIIAGIFLCSLSAVLLIGFNKKRRLDQYLLAMILLILSWYGLFHPLRTYGWVTEYPFILRIGVPFYYLIPPFAFWYTGLKLGGSPPRLKYVLAHLAPAIISVADISWYYVKEYDNLREIAMAVTQNFDKLFDIASGFLPAVTHYILRPVQGCIYSAFSCYLCYVAYHNGSLKRMPFTMRSWLVLFNITLTGIYVTLFDLTIINPPEEFPLSGFYVGMWRVGIITFLFCLLGLVIFFCPSVLYGDQKKDGEELKPGNLAYAGYPTETGLLQLNPVHAFTAADKTPALKTVPLLTPDRVTAYVKTIEDAMYANELFKTVNTINDMAVKLNISARYLSYILSNHYNQRFNDFINAFRIKYVIAEFKSGKLKGLTMEWIGREAGFASRTAFFTAFKKHTGVNPTRFLKDAV